MEPTQERVEGETTRKQKKKRNLVLRLKVKETHPPWTVDILGVHKTVKNPQNAKAKTKKREILGKSPWGFPKQQTH